MTQGGIRAYARHRGVDPMAVEKALKTGRIEKEPNGKIDFDKADASWDGNTTPKMQGAEAPDKGGNKAPLAYTQSRAAREFYLAHLARLQLEQLTGKLVPKEEVQAAAFSTYREYRDRMLNIPDRIAAVFAAELGVEIKKCHEILSTEIRRALNDFADHTESPTRA